MYCPKCGTELPEDSAFCIKCGAKIENTTVVKAPKKHLIRKLVKNRISNMILIVICVVLSIVGFKAGKDNYPRIENKKEIVTLEQQLIDLTDSSPYVLGSSAKYREEMKEYQSDLTKTLILTYGGYTLSILGAIGTCILGYNLFLIYKKKEDQNVL